jgi:proton glutamate symport protein
MSLTTRILSALAAGLVLGALLAHWAPGGPLTAADVIGALWLNALRMTIVPLVFAMLVTGAATAVATAAAGGIAARALLIFVVLLVASAVFGVVATDVLLAWSPISPESVAAIRSGLDAAGGALPQVAPLSEWVKGLVPANPLRAAVEDAMVPLVVFALLFGFAAARLRDEMRDRLVGFFQALAEAMRLRVERLP